MKYLKRFNEDLSSEEKRFTCQDCGNPDYKMYMVNNDLWSKYGNSENTLCMSCLEKRIGRKLTKHDFSDYKNVPANLHNIEVQKICKQEDGETPPKWVKNPKSWAMDKLVSLLTPESISQIANYYISSGAFNFKELDKVKSNIKAIYQSCKDKKELDVTDHVRRFDIKGITDIHQGKGDKDKVDLAKKFENLLRYFQK